jgi:hypothetical protein
MRGAANSSHQAAGKSAIDGDQLALNMLASKQSIGRFDAMLIGAVAGQPSAQTRQPELTALYHAIDAAPERGLGLRMQELEALLKPSTYNHHCAHGSSLVWCCSLQESTSVRALTSPGPN